MTTITMIALLSLLFNVLLVTAVFYLSTRPNSDRSHILRAQLEATVDTLGLRREFAAGFAPTAPLARVHQLLERNRELEARLALRARSYKALTAAEDDCRRMAHAIETGLLTGLPYDLLSLSALETYYQRKGKRRVRSPRLN